MSGPQVWPGVFRTTHHQSKGGVIAALRNQDLIKSQKLGPLGTLGSEQQDCSRVFIQKGEPNSWRGTCRNKREGTHPPQLLSCATGCVIWGGGGLKKFESGQGGLLEIIKRLSQFNYKISVSDTGLVSCCEPGPGLICPPVIVLGIRHLHVVTESDENFGLSQLLYSGPLAQLEQEQKKKKSWRKEN